MKRAITSHRQCTPRRGLASAVACAVALLALAGCGSRLRTVPVNGTVTFGGTSPPYDCIVTFLPTGVELPSSPVKGDFPMSANGMGECDASGTFSARCLRDRHGLIPGQYEVMILCYEPVTVPNATPVSVVPADFKAPELVVPADARSVRYDVDVPAAAK